MDEKKLSTADTARLGSLAPFFAPTGDDWRYEFHNGLVWAHVDADIEGRNIGILEWSAFDLRKGSTRKSLEQLRSYFDSIEILGSSPENDPENPVAWQCWSKMFEEGLVDYVVDHHGRELTHKKRLPAKPG